MDAANSQCPKCEGLMERGFVFDQSLTSSRLLRWVEGEASCLGSSGSHTGSVAQPESQRPPEKYLPKNRALYTLLPMILDFQHLSCG